MRYRLSIAMLAVFLLAIASAHALDNYTISQSQATNINEWNTCKRVINNAGKNLFIPTRTQAEWNTFINNVPVGVTLTYCTTTAPLSLSATRQGTQAALSWSYPSTDYGVAVTGYKIYRATSSGAETFLTTIGATRSYINLNVLESSNYYYKVSAVNAGGESALSNEASITSCNPSVITSYGTWSSCSVSCGGGTQTRTNVNQCGDSVTETQNCNTQSCCDPNVMTSCGSWSSCSTTCGTGTQTRTCTNQCGNSVTQTQSCTDNSGYNTVSSCPGWNGCSTTCGSGTQSRTCTSVCGTGIAQSQGCTDTSSVGVISSYSGWGSCSTTCGSGTQYRTAYYVCGGSTTQSQGCYDGSSLGQVSSCSGWDECSGGCGSGTQYRTCYYTCGGSYTDSQGCYDGSNLGIVSYCDSWTSCGQDCRSYQSCYYVCGGGYTDSRICENPPHWYWISGQCQVSCGVAGGNYCSHDVCPAGYHPINRPIYDCNPCCTNR